MARGGEEYEPDETLRGTAEFMIGVAIKSFMVVHNVDLDTAKRCILNTVIAMLEKEESREAVKN